MYFNWLDRWDEQRARRGEEGKEPTGFILDADRAFPGEKVDSFREFCARADRASTDPTFFEEPHGGDHEFEADENWVKFPSAISTEVTENNIVWAKITRSGPFDRALVIFHHWNARARNPQIASFFSKRGITVFEIAMPYHFERSRPGSVHADYMLSANLGRTVEAVKQAVCDGRKLIRWLKCEGFQEISVLGMSLGSWVAGLIAAHDTTVAKASLFLAGGSLADMVWTGRATRSIRESLEPELDLIDLRRAWGPLNLENYLRRLARPDLDLQFILAKRDTVVLPKLSESLIRGLRDAGGRQQVLKMNCGHYSLGKSPYIIFAGLRARRFLS
ncbi:dienelactone hydrolase-related enzyme (plasmid) [Rhizobium sp. T1470]|uniref:RcgR family putative quorum lactone hydrolase n=1 Tax=unclassified Rhizobium TaxID=2613769 RepID=UPI001AAE46FC|nr:dienelactone hydrolase-related enzyme [Rhizobium sp. T1473]MCA0807352.1 dienelactone hydrolase-related enzyme [Rhizobium sp. T1473]